MLATVAEHIRRQGTAVPRGSYRFLLSSETKNINVDAVKFGIFFVACIAIMLLLAGRRNGKVIPLEEDTMGQGERESSDKALEGLYQIER